MFWCLCGELQSQAFVHVIQACNQDSSAVVLLIHHMLAALDAKHPEIRRAYFPQDNLGCTVLARVHWSSTLITNIKPITRLGFSNLLGWQPASSNWRERCDKCCCYGTSPAVSWTESVRETLTQDQKIAGISKLILGTSWSLIFLDLEMRCTAYIWAK